MKITHLILDLYFTPSLTPASAFRCFRGEVDDCGVSLAPLDYGFLGLASCELAEVERLAWPGVPARYFRFVAKVPADYDWRRAVHSLQEVAEFGWAIHRFEFFREGAFPAPVAEAIHRALAAEPVQDFEGMTLRCAA